MKEALEIAKKTRGDEGSNVAAPLIRLGTIDREAGRFEEGQSKLRRALAIRERLGKGHPGVAAVLLELAELDQARGDNALAESEYERALSILGEGRLARASARTWPRS